MRRGPLRRIDITFSLEATYEELVAWMREIDHPESFVTVDAFTVTRRPDGRLIAALRLVTWRLDR